MSGLPYSPAADLFLIEPRTDDEPYVSPEREPETPDYSELETAQMQCRILEAAYHKAQTDLDVTTRTASMLAEIAHAEILATQRERDALKATLAELRSVALLARDCQRNGDTFGVTLQCGLILNALLGADAVGSAAPGVAMTEEAA